MRNFANRYTRTTVSLKCPANYIVLLFLFFSIVGLLQAAEVEISAYVDRSEISIDEVITFTVEVEGASDFPDIPQPDSPDFFVVSGPSHSSNIQIINGEISASKSAKWRLAPSKAGKLEIKPIQIRYKRKIYKTKPIEITVSDKPSAPKKRVLQSTKRKRAQVSPKADGLKLFLKGLPSKTTVYKGEEVDVDFYLYYSNLNIRNYSQKKLPDAQGFWTEPFPVNSNPRVTSEILNGERFGKARILRLAFFPTTTGALVIDPMVIACQVIIPRQRQRSLFDDFFDYDPFFSKTVAKDVSSEPIKITVKPLPAQNQPSDFTGITGRYSMSSSIDTLETEQDQAFTVKYMIRGNGNIEALTLPSPKFPNSVEVFEPKISKKVDNKGRQIKGLISYEYVLIPRRSGKIEVPPLSISYFDPNLESYRRIKSERYRVNVKPHDRAFGSSDNGLSKEEISLLGEDIRFITRESGTWRLRRSTFLSSVWFWLLNLIAFLIFISSVGFRWWTDKLETNITFARRRRAWNSAQTKIKEAESIMNSEMDESFYTSLDHAIVGFISDRLGLPKSGIGINEIRDKLGMKNIDSDIVEKVSAFINDLSLARFSFQSMDESRNKSLIQDCKSLLSMLGRII